MTNVIPRRFYAVIPSLCPYCHPEALEDAFRTTNMANRQAQKAHRAWHAERIPRTIHQTRDPLGLQLAIGYVNHTFEQYLHEMTHKEASG